MTLISSLSPATSVPVDPLSVTINGQPPLIGWEEVRVTRSLERPPSSFDVAFTEIYKTPLNPYTVNPGDKCTVKIGNDTVLTGYVDSYASEITAHSHSVRISGRSKCEDLYDCSAEQQAIVFTGLENLANALGKPYGVTASRRGSWQEKTFPALQINLTQSAYSIIEMVARYMGVLIYDDADGNVVLSDVGAGNMGSGVSQGINAQMANLNLNNSGRFKTYKAIYQSVNSLGALATDLAGIATDSGITRERTLVFTSEQNSPGYATATLRANYEAARRFGRGQVVHAIVNSWRDTNGKLWEPNFYIPLDIPALKLTADSKLQWVIAEVSYIRNLQVGTIAQLVMMPKDAFSVEPLNPTSAAGVILQPGWTSDSTPGMTPTQ